MVVTKNALLLRDNEGNRLPVEEHSELFGGTVKILPPSEGDFAELKQGQFTEEQMIGKFLVEPKLSEEELKNMPKKSRRELYLLILMATGMLREEAELNLKKGIEMMSERLKKN